MDIQIRFASKEDKQLILKFEDYLKEKRLNQILENNEIILAFDKKRNIGYLRYQLFWTKLPIFNLEVQHLSVFVCSLCIKIIYSILCGTLLLASDTPGIS